MKFQLIIDQTREEEVVATVHQRSELTDRLEALLTEPAVQDRIPAYRDDEIVLLEFRQIECITVVDGKTYAIDGKGQRYRLKQRLYEVEERLPPSFIRINKSTLANEDRLERFVPTFSGAVDAVFRCGFREYVSRRCFAAIKRRYDER